MLARYQNKVIGEIKDHVLYKSVNPDKHFMREFSAWGIDSAALNKVSEICLKVKGNGRIWASKALFEQHGVEREFGNFGRQMFLQEKYWLKVV